jgi:glutathione reductase (NADPH)
VEKSLKKAGIEPLHGAARFLDPETAEVAGERIRAERFVIATGARPAPLGVAGEEHVLDGHEFMELETLPSRTCFIGAGYVSFELAYAAAVAGVEAEILHRSDRPLKQFDPDLVNLLVQDFAEQGVKVRLNSPVTGVRKAGDGFSVQVGDEEVACQAVVHGAGRVAAVERLDLEAGGVRTMRGGVAVDEYMRNPGNPRVYAAGDVAGVGWPLTPTAVLHAQAAARNILEGDVWPVNHAGIPSALFTVPRLARAGLLESEAREQGLPVRKAYDETGGGSFFRRVGESRAGYKLLVHQETGAILGAHLLGFQADEAVNLFGMAIRAGLGVEDLRSMVWAYPSRGYRMRHMLDAL